MKAVVCYSGGHSSALAAVEAVRRYGRNNVILLNHDISPRVEHGDIKRFKDEVAAYLGIKITYVNAEHCERMTPLEVCRSLKAFQYRPGIKLCTGFLKTEPFNKWLNSHYPATNTSPCKAIVILYGFDDSEPERINRRRKVLNEMGYAVDFPLVLWDRTISNIEEIGVKRPSTYKTWKHANCIGCLKAGKQHWYCVFCLRPDIWEEAKTAEAEIGYSIIKGVFLKELEPQFEKMREIGIVPMKKKPPRGFGVKLEKKYTKQPRASS